MCNVSLRGIHQLLFADLPVGDAALDESRDGHKQQHQDVDRGENLVDCRWLLDSKRQHAFMGNVTMNARWKRKAVKTRQRETWCTVTWQNQN